MISSKKSVIFLILAMSSTQISMCSFSPSKVIRKVYCKVFGEENASKNYQLEIRKALNTCNVTHADDVDIKKMNRIASKLIGQELYSFTLTGIWIDESSLAELNEAERTFLFYHEAAHYACKHHQKLLFYTVPPTILIPAVSYVAHNKWMPSENKILTYASSAITSVAAIAAVMKFSVQSISKLHEKEADLLAASAMIKDGKKYLLELYIEQLEEIVLDGYGNQTEQWHNTISEQASYLREFLNQ